MKKKVLLVGLRYEGPDIADAEFEVLGLCRAEVNDSKASFVLYEYDVVIIYPESYSHFLFGEATEYSTSDKELWSLKSSNNNYDLDTAYDEFDRTKELDAAISRGTKVVWLLTPDKRIHFFGWRSLYSGYANQTVKEVLEKSTIHNKKSRQLSILPDAAEFTDYFESLREYGWRMCIADYPDGLNAVATSPEGYCLGAQLRFGNASAWLLTAPTSKDSANRLIQCALSSGSAGLPKQTYHGLFLSHTSEDKPFVRKLRDDLLSHGVTNVWLDEAELLVGDSLTKKISAALLKTKYVGVVLSPRSIKSPWVEKELEAAMTRELATGEVVVLPMLYEACELPIFLAGKLYADFTSHERYKESLSKILRRLKSSGDK